MHQDKYDGCKGNARKEKLKQLKLSLCKQRSFFANINQSNKNSVKASFAISEIIVKSLRPFTESLFIKECLLKSSKILCPNQKKLFEGISLSPNNSCKKDYKFSCQCRETLLATAMDFEAFPIALDESTNSSGTAQCAIFIRGVDCQLNVTEEFLDLIPLKGTATVHDLFQALENCIQKYALPWERLVCLATDNALAMCSSNVGTVWLVKNKLNSLETEGINFASVHCILHQEALCSKSLQMKEMMNLVVKTLNFIRSRGLSHWKFKSFLVDMDSEYGELLYHTEVKWFSRGKVLKRFFALRNEIALFMETKNNPVSLLADFTF